MLLIELFCWLFWIAMIYILVFLLFAVLAGLFFVLTFFLPPLFPVCIIASAYLTYDFHMYFHERDMNPISLQYNWMMNEFHNEKDKSNNDLEIKLSKAGQGD